jgi:hypothetical protein
MISLLLHNNNSFQSHHALQKKEIDLRVGDGVSRTHCHIWLMKTGYPYRLQALQCIE